MKKKYGSYQYEVLEREAQSKEYERLQHQGSALLQTERRLWPEIGILPGDSVLDIGCGTGIVTRELAEQVYPAKVIGVDISQELLMKSEQSCSEDLASNTVSENITFQQGTVYQLPFASNSFDTVYVRLLFQHLERPLEALREIWRVLKPDGLLCILDIDRSWSSLYPEPETSIALDKALIDKQRSQGGDPWIGRKLGYYLNLSSFYQVRTRVELIDSDRLGIGNFFRMLSFGDSYPAEKNKLSELREKARPDVQRLIESPYAWAGFGLFVVTGQKASAP